MASGWPRTSSEVSGLLIRKKPNAGGQVKTASRATRRDGALVLIGGAEDRLGEARILTEFCRLAGAAKARIVVVTVASEQPVELGNDYLRVFKRIGCKEAIRLDIADRACAAE